MIRRITKINANVFSSSQLATSVVPINELAHAMANAPEYANSHKFLLNGTLPFDIAMVNPIKIVSCLL